MKTIKLYTLFVVAALAFFGCDKKKDNPAPAYRWENGNCLNSSNQPVPSNYCSGIANNGFIYQNGLCIQQSTGQQYPMNYCQQTTGNNGFIYQNGLCIQQSTGQQYPMNYCQQTTGNNGFIYQNGLCIQQSTGQQYPASYCQGTGMAGEQCAGKTYYYNSGWGLAAVQCGVQTNCSGYWLYNSSMQPVYCQ